MTTPAPDLSPAEAEIVARFEAAPYPPEVEEARVVEEVARAMFAAAHPSEDWLTGYPEDMRKYFRRLAAAAVAAYRATQDGGAEEAVRYPCYCLPGSARCDDPYTWCDRAALAPQASR